MDERIKQLDSVQLCEGVSGMWRYHLCPSDDDTGTKSLCGARTMHSYAVLSSWGFVPKHMPTSYCEECESIALKTTPVGFK